jgi:aminopeptidase N
MKYFCSFLGLLLSFTVLSQKNKSGGLLKPEQALMDIRHYTVALEVKPSTQSINGYAEIDFITNKTTDVLLFDLVESFTIDKVWVNGKEEPFKFENELIRVSLVSPLASGKVKVKIQYGGKPIIAPRPPWKGGFTWAADTTGAPWVAVTCQSQGAKMYFPCKDHPSDEPNEGADLIITVPKGLVVAGPGLLQSKITKKDKTTFHWKTNYTINNYSILFNIGRFKVVSRNYTTINGHTVPMQFYVLKEHADKAEKHLDIFERTVRTQEKYFGEYPWIKEKIAICETPHLGMEHQTMNAYGNKFRYTVVGGKEFDWLMHHEFGHEWWGNKITGIDWADMWIQEGICSFGDALYTLDHEGEEAYLKRMERTGRATQNKLPVVLGENLDADTVYHGDIYGKGAFFMHTLRYVIGDDIFFPALKKFATSPEYTYDNLVNTNNVEAFFSKESNQNLKPLFDFYLRTINKLEVDVKKTGDEEYQITALNYSDSLPVDVVIDDKIERKTISSTPIKVKSKTTPVIDPKSYYLKKVIYE